MGLPKRQIRAVLAAVVLCLLLFVGAEWHWDISDNTAEWFKHIEDQSLGRFRPDQSSTSVSPELPAPNAEHATQHPALVENAHRLSTADDFRDHFQGVMSLKGMTIADAKAGCTWESSDYVNFQYGQDVEWAVKDRPDPELAQRRLEWHSFVHYGTIPWDKAKEKFDGRGIIILAGNSDTLKRVKVLLRALVQLKSTVAVEIHYWEKEMTEEAKKDLQDLYPPGLFFNDLSGEHNLLQVKKDGIFGINYQLKTASVINSRFAEPFLLDSDNIPVIKPEELYDSPTYKEYGSIFWPDIARTRPENPMWAITNTACRMDEYEQESGQLLVDKRRFWYHLQLASWLNNEQGEYYNKFLLGDKDMFRFAWHALKTQYGKPKKWLTSVGTLNDDDYCGHTFAQHHPDSGEVAFLHGGLLKTVNNNVMKWNREHGGVMRNYKRAPTDEQPDVSVRVLIRFDGAAYMHSDVDKGALQCTDMSDVEARDLNEIVPGVEKMFEEIGGYWMLEKT